MDSSTWNWCSSSSSSPEELEVMVVTVVASLEASFWRFSLLDVIVSVESVEPFSGAVTPPS